MIILYITACVTSDNVMHAGGQAHNFYLKKLADFKDINIISIDVASVNELVLCDLNKYDIEYYGIGIDNGFIEKLTDELKDINLFNAYGCMMSAVVARKLSNLFFTKKLYKRQIDVVIMEYTEITLMIDVIKKFFPYCIYIAVERDIAFQGYFRKFKISKNPFIRLLWKYKYQKLKESELKALNKCDLIVTHNNKDFALLKAEKIVEEQILIVSPYYNRYQIQYMDNSYDILFFGAMNRPENYLSIIWFIEKVMPYIDQRYQLHIVGAKPDDCLKKYVSNRIIVTGKIDYVDKYFEKMFCLVAPLLIGAGVKIKVLECMYMGMPVITNHIGIEGINAIPGKHYIHCETAEEYINALNDKRNEIVSCRHAAIEFMKSTEYEYDKAVLLFKNKIHELLSYQH